jgi:hypothetical protein
VSYSAGEALILTQVQAVSGFGTTNTSRGKYAILNSGNAAVYAILHPGPFEAAFAAVKTVHTDWNTIIEVWQRYKDDGTTLTNLEANVQAILTRLNLYRHMADTTNSILDAVATVGGDVIEMTAEGGGGPIWLKQEVIVAWKEESLISPAE